MHRHAKTLVALLLLGVGTGVFAVTFAQAVFYTPQEAEGPPPANYKAHAAVAEDAPVRLRIPALGIDAQVQHVGVKENGQMANPNNFTDVGWYKYGTMPGYRGSAVMAGHVDNGLSLAGVFTRLGALRAGEMIEVESVSGEVQRFVVEEVATYPYQEVPAERVFNRADAARLVLITCDGAWLKGEKTYDRRLVVYARLSP